jgi:hypothetical protein
MCFMPSRDSGSGPIKSITTRSNGANFIGIKPWCLAVPCPAIVRRFPFAHDGQLFTHAFVSAYIPNQKYSRTMAS